MNSSLHWASANKPPVFIISQHFWAYGFSYCSSFKLWVVFDFGSVTCRVQMPLLENLKILYPSFSSHLVSEFPSGTLGVWLIANLTLTTWSGDL